MVLKSHEVHVCCDKLLFHETRESASVFWGVRYMVAAPLDLLHDAHESMEPLTHRSVAVPLLHLQMSWHL